MYHCTKKRFFVVFTSLLLLISGIFFLSEDGGITGAVIASSTAGLSLEIPEGDNDNVDVDSLLVNTTKSPIPEDNSSLPDTLSGQDQSISLDTQSVDSSGSLLMVALAANATQCGTVNANLTLTTNVNITSTCFLVNASNIVINCAGKVVNYSSAGALGYGVNNTNFSNVVVKNCIFLEGRTNSNTQYAIYYDTAPNGTIQNNTIVTIGASAGIQVTNSNQTRVIFNNVTIAGDGVNAIAASSSSFLNISSNSLTALTDGTYGINLATSLNSYIQYNNISLTGSGNRGIYGTTISHSNVLNNNVSASVDSGYAFDITGENVTIRSNRINIRGTSTPGINLGSNTLIADNVIVTEGDQDAGLYITGGNSTFSNNNITVNTSYAGTWELRDLNVCCDYINYLVYENSVGKIEWVDNGTGGFPRSMSSGGRIGYAYNFFISNNSVAFNGSLNSGLMNSSPRKMTLFDLPFATITQVFRLANISTDETFIRNHGTNCIASGCSLVGYGANKVIFNTSLLGSFALNGTALGTNTAPNTTLLIVNASTFKNHTDNMLFCQAKGEDSEQTLLDAYWSWYKNGVLYNSGITTIANGTLTTLATISAGNTDRLDEWNCSVFMYDGFENESDRNNGTLKIAPYLCNDYVTTSATLTAHITECTGNGLGITTGNLTLDCDHKLIAGSSSAIGINISGTNVTIKNCNISGFRDGMYLNNLSNSLITNNTINGSARLGIFIDNMNLTTLSLNIIKDTTSGGIYFNRTTQNNTISNNTILRNKAQENGDTDMIGAISFKTSNGFNHIFQYNNLSHNLRRAMWMASSFNSTFRYNLYWNNSEGSDPPTTDSVVSNEKYIANGIALNTSGSRVTGGGMTIRDSIFESNTIDLKIIDGDSGNITFINSTMNKDRLSVPANYYAYFKSIVDVNITIPGGIALFNATAQAYTSQNILNDENTTNNNGTARLLVTEFYNTAGINYIITPSIIKVFKGNYTKNSTEIDLLNLSYYLVNLTIKEFTCGGSVISEVQLGNNYFCSDTAIVVTASNVTFEGGSKTIEGLMAGSGIRALNQQYVAFNNLIVRNFTYGVYFQHTNNSNFTNLRVTNTSIGFFFNSSHNNKLYDVFIMNNTNSSIYAVSDGETNTSLVNVSIYNLENISIGGNANVYRKWWVVVNATLNGDTPFSGVNASLYYDATDTLDTPGQTATSGLVRLAGTELKKNSSGVNYLTSTNISIKYTYRDVTYENSTVINLTQTNNTIINLRLTLSCAVPKSNSYISTSTTYCPGTYSVTNITVNTSGVTLTCENTILTNPNADLTGIGIDVNPASHASVSGCILENYPLRVHSTTNTTISNITITGRGIICTDSTRGTFQNISTSGSTSTGMTMYNCNNTLIIKNTIQNYFGVVMNTENIVGSSGFPHHNIFRNNTFKNNNQALFVGNANANNTFYHNNFTSISSWAVRNSDATNNFSIHVNASINFSFQGNEWSDYCDKGLDLNGDGYADTNRIGSSDYPFNASTSSHIPSDIPFNDWGPRIITCPATTVFLTSSGASSTSAKAAAGGGAAAVAPSAPSAATTATTSASAGSNGGGGGGSFYSAADVKKFLKTSEGAFESKKSEQGLEVYVTLENTGELPMKIQPLVQQEADDPLFMLTRKTLGGENSGLQTIAKLSYSKNPIAGTLLKAILINQEEIIIPPGGKVEKALQVKEGFGATKPLKIQFSSLGETVLEKDVKVEKKASSAAAVDTHENYLDIYAVLVPEGAEKTDGVIVGSELTGAAIFDNIPILAQSNSPYFLELTLNKKNKFGKLNTVFTDQYGPYPLKKGESFLFAQQLKYDPAIYSGNYVVQTKMYHGPALVVQNEFDVTLGETENTNSNSILVWLGLLAIIMIVLAQGLYFMNVYYKN